MPPKTGVSPMVAAQRPSTSAASGVMSTKPPARTRSGGLSANLNFTPPFSLQPARSISESVSFVGTVLNTASSMNSGGFVMISLMSSRSSGRVCAACKARSETSSWRGAAVMCADVQRGLPSTLPDQNRSA